MYKYDFCVATCIKEIIWFKTTTPSRSLVWLVKDHCNKATNYIANILLHIHIYTSYRYDLNSCISFQKSVKSLDMSCDLDLKGPIPTI